MHLDNRLKPFEKRPFVQYLRYIYDNGIMLATRFIFAYLASPCEISEPRIGKCSLQRMLDSRDVDDASIDSSVKAKVLDWMPSLNQRSLEYKRKYKRINAT